MTTKIPKIKKVHEKWQLHYFYNPRMFSLFGLVDEERQQVVDSCCVDEYFETWDQAISYLKSCYKLRLINLR